MRNLIVLPSTMPNTDARYSSLMRGYNLQQTRDQEFANGICGCLTLLTALAILTVLVLVAIHLAVTL